MAYNFSDKDQKEIEVYGLGLDQIAYQLEIFRRGTFFYKLDRPCTLQDGIVSIPGGEQGSLVELYDRERAKGRMSKFIPASGAASRMFKEWHRQYTDLHFLENESFSTDFTRGLSRYPFFQDLTDVVSQSGSNLKMLIEKGDARTIFEYILTPRGLNYANIPKALIKFHRYPEGDRTALEEHLVEAALYVSDENHVARIYFTLSSEHRNLVEAAIKRIMPSYEERFQIHYEIGLSIQLRSTDTIAADSKNQPFRDKTGRLVFRPGGHGALLENLNALNGDIVSIKNIDNIVPDHLKDETVLYKKILGGYLVRLQGRIFNCLHQLADNQVRTDLLSRIAGFCEREINVVFPEDFEGLEPEMKKKVLADRLNRPLRVCGMVRNEGEPGGGPFWVKEEDGTKSIQIIEQAQVDFREDEQKRIWKSATYFNPVDLACAVRDFSGNPFDLRGFVDRRAFFIAEKSQEGRELKALEYPGLWNGAMARWNTVFLEVPIETFNPVKTIDDLLRKQHQ